MSALDLGWLGEGVGGGLQREWAYHFLQGLHAHLLLLGRFAGGVVATTELLPALVGAAVPAPGVARGTLAWGSMRSVSGSSSTKNRRIS